jgi:hypothetical protein
VDPCVEVSQYVIGMFGEIDEDNIDAVVSTVVAQLRQLGEKEDYTLVQAELEVLTQDVLKVRGWAGGRAGGRAGKVGERMC